VKACTSMTIGEDCDLTWMMKVLVGSSSGDLFY
jgi:hypothetical protein